jgi:hypothetical protein
MIRPSQVRRNRFGHEPTRNDAGIKAGSHAAPAHRQIVQFTVIERPEDYSFER